MHVPTSRRQNAPPPSLRLDQKVVTMPAAQTTPSLIFPRSKSRPATQTVVVTHSTEPLRSRWPAISHSIKPSPSHRLQPPSRLRDAAKQKEDGMPFRLLTMSFSYYAHTHVAALDRIYWNKSQTWQRPRERRIKVGGTLRGKKEQKLGRKVS